MTAFHAQPRNRATAAGFGAIALWSTTIAISRSLSEQLGPVTAAAVVYAISGAISIAVLALNPQKRLDIRRLPRSYVVICGALFISYMLFLYLSVGLAATRQQALETGMLNYLWPALTLVLSVTVLRYKPGLFFIPGTVIAVSGVFLVLSSSGPVSCSSVFSNITANPVPYALGLAAAVSWSAYSILTRKLIHGRQGGGIEVFLPVTAVVLLVLCACVHEPRAWSARAAVELLYLGGATWAGYALWDLAMRRGNMTLVAAGSYLTPLLSALISCLYLSIAASVQLWTGCAILIAGSMISWRSVSVPDPVPSTEYFHVKQVRDHPKGDVQ